jgi:hypothetical protein
MRIDSNYNLSTISVKQGTLAGVLLLANISGVILNTKSPLVDYSDNETFNSVLDDPSAVRKLYAGSEKSLNREYSTVGLAVIDKFSKSAPTGTSDWHIYEDAFEISSFRIQETKGDKISLAQASSIAMNALLDAENRRKKERETEAAFLAALDGEE